jgi:hypothetical protein
VTEAPQCLPSPLAVLLQLVGVSCVVEVGSDPHRHTRKPDEFGVFGKQLYGAAVMGEAAAGLRCGDSGDAVARPPDE